MLSFKILNSRILRENISYLCRRSLLSNAFECSDVWNSRLNSPLIRNVNLESMFYELDNQYNRMKQLNAIDVDIFVNAQKNDMFITEVEEIVHKFRLTRDASNVLPTTHHAFIRLFLDANRKDDLIRVLNDRLNYGIFPDNYCTSFILNRLLKENDTRNAAKVAVFPMLQEDFSNSLVNYLSLYAVHQYIMSNEAWNDPPPIQVQEDDDEEVTIKIPFIRNPYNDEQFDLTDGNHLCGKFFYKISSVLDDAAMANSYKIMGLALFEKWDQLKEQFVRLEGLLKQNESVLYRESLDYLENLIKEKSLDELTTSGLMKSVERLKKESRLKENLLQTVEEIMKREIDARENTERLSQEKLYKDWEKLREQKLNEYLKEANRLKRLEEIKRKKEELQRKEELLYFFDNEDEIDLVVEKKLELIKKRTFPETTTQQEEDYIPPTVPKRGFQDDS